MKEEILNYLKLKIPKLCVMATCSPSGKPECAVTEYSVLDDLTVIICTIKQSRKWQNLKNNHNIALTFGFVFEELNIQYEGIAELIERKTSSIYQQCEEEFFITHPQSLKYKGMKDTAFVKITPIWLRLSDFTIDPPRIEELTL